MFEINRESVEDLRLVKNISYAKRTGLDVVTISNIFTGKKTTTECTAKAIISVAYNISLLDSQIDELMKKHFIQK